MAEQGYVAASQEEQHFETQLAQKDQIMAAARANPNEALFDRNLYIVGTPDEIREIVGDRRIEVRTREVTYNIPRGPGPVSQLPFLPSKGRYLKYESPLAIASYVTPYPEVIHILVKAGCKVTDVKSEPLFGALHNENPKVLEALLQYKPDLEVGKNEATGTPLLSALAGEPKDFKQEQVRLLLAAGADPNARDDDYDTPLMKAAMYKNTEAVKMLLTAGADPSQVRRNNRYALDIAISNGAYEAAHAILAKGAPVSYGNGESPLERLARRKDADMELAGIILEKLGSDSEATKKAFVAAAREGRFEMVVLLLERNLALDTVNEAFAASITGGRRSSVETASLLLVVGADPNLFYNGAPMICWSSWFGLPGQVALLLNAGADANARDNKGRTPLCYLADGGKNIQTKSRDDDHYRTMAVLVDAKADINAEGDDGMPPILRDIDNPFRVWLYLRNGADPNAVSGSGWTPLTYAVEKGNAETIRVLLEGGADSKKKDGKRRKPAELAKKLGRTAIYEQLK